MLYKLFIYIYIYTYSSIYIYIYICMHISYIYIFTFIHLCFQATALLPTAQNMLSIDIGNPREGASSQGNIVTQTCRWADLVDGIGFLVQSGCGIRVSKVGSLDLKISVFSESRCFFCTPWCCISTPDWCICFFEATENTRSGNHAIWQQHFV